MLKYLENLNSQGTLTFSSWNLVSSTNRIKTYRATYSQQTLYIWNKYSTYHPYTWTNRSDKVDSATTGHFAGPYDGKVSYSYPSGNGPQSVNDFQFDDRSGLFTLKGSGINGSSIIITNNVSGSLTLSGYDFVAIIGSSRVTSGKYVITSVNVEVDKIFIGDFHYNYDATMYIDYRVSMLNSNVTNRGDLIGTVTSTQANIYPDDGLYSDGYWYIKR